MCWPGEKYVLLARCTSDCARSSRLAGGCDGRIELGAEAVDVELCCLDGLGLAATQEEVVVGSAVDLRQFVLGVLQVAAEAVDVVQPGGSADSLRVGLEPGPVFVGELFDLREHLEDCADVDVVPHAVVDAPDLLFELRVDADLHLEDSRLPLRFNEQRGNENQEQDDEDQQDGVDGHGSPFLRCAVAPSGRCGG